VVRDNIAELNAVGYEGTNASGDMYVVGNRLVGNRVGLTTDSDHQEKVLPQQGAVVAGNLVAANQQAATPEQADGGWGIGIGVDGGSSNQFLYNRVSGGARGAGHRRGPGAGGGSAGGYCAGAGVVRAGGGGQP